ncbi:XkdF-like putative serine protease domain-containing protein [Pseudarthrobacter cellobiosi]|uniref:XkdF-like putative serine protease domain-containing protein n=1 Tax=Pseudarthrobacter cellobiosi TaxID=2953654 RepID=UPI00208E6D71|nr:XkdF-like putative serine protease domain-containing protein [Pseudarthrobacter sp. HLT1-5]MCO4257405.1 XkdF-like putative serine protease domain-containing protein [Pseudarthrobacter sp. HLT1-5]
MADEQRYLLGIAYQAGPDPRIATGADGSRDFFSPAELEKAAWEFAKSSRSIGLFHENGSEGHADVVESYIFRGPDWDLGDGVIVKAGDWLIGAVLDERAWDMYKSGDITGFSPQGTAKRRRPTDPVKADQP